MTTRYVLYLVFMLLSSLGLFLAFLLLGQNVRKQKGKKFDFMTEFPFEFVGEREQRSALSRNLLLGYAIFDAVAALFMLLTAETHQGLVSLSVVYFLINIFKDAALVANCLVPAYETKPHLLSFVLFGGLLALSSIVGTILLFNMSYINLPLAIVFGVIAGCVSLFTLGAIVNPKLSGWSKMLTTMDEDGNVDTSRPRPFILAFTEWLLLFANVIATTFSLLGFGIITLLQIFG